MRKRAASLERINDAPLTRHEKLAKVSLGVEQFAGAWERRLAQQRTTLLTAEEQEPAELDTWAALEPDVPPEPGFDEEFEEVDLKEDEIPPEGGEWLDAAWLAQAEAESAAKQAIEEDALTLKKQRRREREGPRCRVGRAPVQQRHLAVRTRVASRTQSARYGQRVAHPGHARAGGKSTSRAVRPAAQVSVLQALAAHPAR